MLRSLGVNEKLDISYQMEKIDVPVIKIINFEFEQIKITVLLYAFIFHNIL